MIPINDCLGTITTTQARECIITSTGHVASAVEGRAGTHIGVRP